MPPGELVEWRVGIERIDDVVAVGKELLVLVAVKSNRVGIAVDVEPPAGHAFAEVG